MGQESDTIRKEIENQRGEMGETVDAIAYKADVPSRVKESFSDKKDRLKSQMSKTTERANDATPGVEDVKGGAKQAVGFAQENPLGLAIGGIAIGFLAGLALPGTKVEDERVGPIASDVKSKAADASQEALEHGKQVAQETVQAATDAAKESGTEHASEMKDSAQEMAQSVAGDGSGDGSGPPS
jgi:ElaB/YqjD/DUF883 family membrane-anchored ribosome-binding protein